MSTFLCPIVLNKVQETIRFNWFKTHECSGSIDELLNFMNYKFQVFDRTVQSVNRGLSILVNLESSEFIRKIINSEKLLIQKI